MKEKEKQLQRLISGILQSKLEQTEPESGKGNNSFIFLEGQTLDLLLWSLLNAGKATETASEGPFEIPQELFDLVHIAKSQNMKEFEDIMKLLREDS